jgi:hypothetical protein
MQKLLRIAFWCALTVAFVLAVLPHPPILPGEPSDKIQHILAFTTLALLGSAAYPRLSALKLLAGLSAFGALIELVQSIPELHRDAELLDWVADTTAVVVVLVAVGGWLRLRSKREA